MARMASKVRSSTTSSPPANGSPRETFESSRALEFFTENQLRARTGHAPDNWALMIAKELSDNGIDACEQRGIAPSISIRIEDDAVSVTDNGPGIPVETLRTSLTNFDVLVSDKAKFVGPTRGAQGNALKTVVAVPYVRDGSVGRVHVSTGGQNYEITVKTEQIQQKPAVTVTAAGDALVQNGTSWRVEYPCLLDECCEDEFVQLATGFALFNPHLSLHLSLPSGDERVFEPSNPTWSKWLPSTPLQPHWYGVADLAGYVGSCLAKDRVAGRQRTVRELIAKFAGVKRTGTQKAVLDRLGLTGAPLSSLMAGETELDLDLVEELLDAMKAEAKEPKPEKLGVIGEEHFREALTATGCNDEFTRYKKLTGMTDDGIPYVVEAALSIKEEYTGPAEVFTGVNWSPSFGRPVVNSLGYGTTLSGMLGERYCGRHQPIVFCLHIATPKVPWTDNGKGSLDLSGALAADVEKASEVVTRPWYEHCRKEERRAQLEERRFEALAKKKPKRTPLNQAIFLEIEGAVHTLSRGGKWRFDGRSFYYEVRELIQKHTTEPLTQKWFDGVLKAWEEEHGVIELLDRDPRGFLIEPHTGRRIPLGTKNVDDYEIPLWLYDTILYIEKKGLSALLEDSKLAEKYDIAIIAAEGYATNAAKILMARAEAGHAMTMLCFHDADHHGKNIGHCMRQASVRSDGVNVIDIGLHLNEALAMGLKPEKYIRKNALPKDLELTKTELEYWTGKYAGMHGKKKKFECQRVELNTLARDPEAFIAYIEAKLAYHGCNKKVVPPDKVIRSEAAHLAEGELRRLVRANIEARLRIETLIESVTGSLSKKLSLSRIPTEVRMWAKKCEPHPWDEIVGDLARDRVARLTDRIERLTEKAVIDAIAQWKTR